MSNINAGTVLRFDNGGVLTLTKSASQYVIANLEGGGVTIEKIPKRKVLPYTDRGVQQVPLEGDDQLALVTVRAKRVLYATGDLFALLSAAGTAGQVNLFDSLEIKTPGYRGSVAGDKFTMTNCWLADDSFKPLVGGADFDGVEFSIEGPNLTPTTF